MIPVPLPVLNALALSFSVQAAQLSHFGGGRENSDGIVYVYPYQQRRRLLKIMAIPEENQRRGIFCLEERLHFMRFLGENEARIVFPEFSPRGKLYETFLFSSHLWIGYCMEIAPGRILKSEQWTPELFRCWGQAVGQMHRLAQGYPSWLSSVDPESGQTALTWQEEWQSFYEWCQDVEVKQKWVEIRTRLEKLPVTRQTFGFIHNDPHQYNLLVEGDSITLLDFDVANHHWFVNDIAIACQGILFDRSGGMQRPVHDRDSLISFLQLFLEGYRRENHLPGETLDSIDLFIAYRRILLFTVMQGWIGSQPGLHDSWKRMILEQPEIVRGKDVNPWAENKCPDG